MPKQGTHNASFIQIISRLVLMFQGEECYSYFYNSNMLQNSHSLCKSRYLLKFKVVIFKKF